jgi:hypothetical protein
MSTGVVTYSKTAATNSTADSAQNWAEGMAPSAVNDSARAGMASVAKWRDDLNGSLATAGGTLAFTLTTNQVFAALTAGYQVAFQMNATNTGTTTLNVDGLGAKPLRSAAGVELLAGSLLIGAVYKATYFTSNSGEWIVESYPVLGDAQIAAAKIASNAVTTAKILDANVTLAKIESRTANTLIGRYTASTGVPQEVTVSTGLALDTSTGNLTSAYPPPASFKNLSIKVASNTTVTVAADFVSTTDGTSFKTTALSGTINLGTNGAANALDAGSIAVSTWYSIWAIAKADGTTAGLASTSATAPTLPTGYTFKARIGWVRTISGSATLYGTWQLGRRAQYIVGLAQTTAMPAIASGAAGTWSSTAPTWASASISSFVPSTASEIFVVLGAQTANGAFQVIYVAPNNSYSGVQSTNPPPASNSSSTAGNATSAMPFSMILESTNIYWANTASGGSIMCQGWIDNI